jgi:hypothetical protein
VKATELPRAIERHASAAAAFATAAESVEAAAWHRPRAEGKWSPAQVTDHLIRAYDVLLRELGGGKGMEIRTRFWQRLFLRFTLYPRLLRGGVFPAAAPAPREIRPLAEPDQPTAIALFRQRAAEFEAAIEQSRKQNPRARLTHAYFGSAPLAEGVLFCARHIEHHRAQLPLRSTAKRRTRINPDSK